MVFHLDESFFIIWVAGMFIFIINSLFIRFADTQSIYMLMFSIATYLAIIIASPLLFISYWLVISPPPYALTDRVTNAPIDLPSPLSPYNIKKITDKVESFLLTIKRNDRVLFAFDNPDGEYDNVFDGYRSLLEVPLYIATKKKFLLVPSWWAVFENNFEGANEFWGRSIKDVKQNVKKYNINYIIAYDQTDAEKESFKLQGYEIVNEMDWANLTEELLNEPVWLSKNPPKWTLYKILMN